MTSQIANGTDGKASTGGGRPRHPLWVWFMAIVLVLPLGLGVPYYLKLLNLVWVWTIVTLGLNLLTGLCGQASLGHAAYYGIGAYTTAILSTRLGQPFWVTIPAAIFLGIIVGAITGYPALKTKGPYLALVTIAFGFIAHTVFLNWRGLTAGYQGIGAIPALGTGETLIDIARTTYFLIAIIGLGSVIAAVHLADSRLGRAWKAINDNEFAAAMCGVDVPGTKLQAFVVSTGFASLAGALYAYVTRFVSPDQFTLDVSIMFLVMLILGGLGSTIGAILGVVIVASGHEILSPFPMVEVFLYGLLIIVTMLFFPRGVSGFLSTIRLPFRGR